MTTWHQRFLARLNGFWQGDDGWWYAPEAWGDEAGPWPTAKAALAWFNKHGF